jgi:hypothetical protein
MSKLRVHISTSLDGFVAGRNQSEANPLGEGGEGLHEWAFELEAMRAAHGMEGGGVNASTPVMQEEIADVGAEIMGRGKFGPPGGGASVINQYLAAGLVDALELHVVPILLGGGARLFEDVDAGLRLEQRRAIDAPGVAHLTYRVAR